MKKVKGAFIVFLIAALAAGCANSPVIDKSNGQKTSTDRRFFELSPSDADIISEVLISLNNQGGEPDYNAAKSKLKIYFGEHPNSKLVESAQALILIIDNVLELQEKVKAESLLLAKENAEKAKLKKDYKYSEEKYQNENAKLQQENEQLKNDIELLKKLEIQMGQREKMLK